MKTLLVNLCRLLLAVVFIFSGYVKAVDPLGTQYKIDDYLGALGLAGTLPGWLTLAVSVGLCALEFTLGVLLLFAIMRRLVSKAALSLMVLMTIVTLWLAVGNPIEDCGCFGDAVKLTNWQTLGKNVVLLCAAIVVSMWPLRMKRFISKTNQWIVTNYTVLFILASSAWSLYRLPLFDFRPYHVGANIKKGMEIPPGAKAPKFETTFILEKDGKQREFTIEDYPDTTWSFVDAKTKVIEKGYEPPIHDFSITENETGEDITYRVLDDKGYTFLLIAPHLEQADDTNFGDIDAIHEYADDNGYGFYCLTASNQKGINHWQDITGAEYPFCTTDATTLKTIIRSNPGLVLLHDGTIIRKWSHNELPKVDELKEPLEKSEIGRLPEDSVPAKIMSVVLWFVLPLLLLTIADRLWAWTRWLNIGKKRKKANIKSTLKIKKDMRKKIVAGNWKMNMNLQDGVALAKELNETLTAEKPNCDVVICTPFIHLASVAQFLNQDVIGLGAENCANKEKGAFTGEVSAEMVKSTGAQYVILGHSERREYYNETPEILKEKVQLALANELKVIFCIGETLAEREAEKQNEVVKAELEGSVFNLTEEEFKNIIIAYEPIWAIGTGKTATAEQAEEIHAYIRSIIAEKYGNEVAENTSILYGGSCKASNAPELFAKPDIDGGLIGGASLKAADFKGIIDAWK
ncbi:MAG: triose-phosphate isomerase [Prevotella sp.]|nr:triose-phosphate isomerase [Prevotella sp.]